ncbi:family 10 glycosylhydrolase [Synechococcus moorigangaii CMS01]|nr:family 10 glycosylhydrolase [Synechococcus moorigangaii CMS01]
MPPRQTWRQRLQSLLISVALSGLTPLTFGAAPAQAQLDEYCRLSPQAIATKDQLRTAALQGNSSAQTEYQALLRQHNDQLQRCRQTHWPRHQAVWLRVYPCDARAGLIERILDDIVNKGYDHLYLEVFADSQALLPKSQNNTPWPSRVQNPGLENRDVMAEVIEKGRARGLKVYAWMFGMNYGYVYGSRGDRQNAMARNGYGETSLEFVEDGAQAFIDPYNPTAIADYKNLINQMLQRQPDGILFDYIRYPRGTGARSVAASVADLWIYSPAAAQALYDRAENRQGLSLIETYLRQGRITVADVAAVLAQYPEDGTPRWQGRTVLEDERSLDASALHRRLENDLWLLTVSHAAQGVVDFVNSAATQAQSRGFTPGAVFFPGGNQTVGQRGFDSRLQPWDKFPASMEWHPMAYAICGSPRCIVDEINRVRQFAPPGTEIIPALAGDWSRAQGNRPSLKDQMAAIKANFPEINQVSHFAYSWLEPQFDNDRKFCRL